MANNKKTFTKAAHQSMLEKLDYLKTVREREVAEKLKEARSFGDLSENAEYDAAKDEQAAVAAEIDKIENMLSNAIILDEDELAEGEVNVGSTVVLKDISDGSVETYKIGSSTESDPDNGVISDESPIGRAALHKKVGDIFDVNAPMGIIEFEVLEITRD